MALTTTATDTRLPLGVYVEDDAEDEPTIWLHVPARPDAPLAITSREQLEQNGVKVLWTYLAEHLPSRDDCLIECPQCEGACEITEILGQDRVSGLIHDQTWPCPACDGTGTVRLVDTEKPDWCDTCGLSGRCRRCAA